MFEWEILTEDSAEWGSRDPADEITEGEYGVNEAKDESRQMQNTLQDLIEAFEKIPKQPLSSLKPMKDSYRPVKIITVFGDYSFTENWLLSISEENLLRRRIQNRETNVISMHPLSSFKPMKDSYRPAEIIYMTGSGKSFSVKWLSSICGEKLLRRSIKNRETNVPPIRFKPVTDSDGPMIDQSGTGKSNSVDAFLSNFCEIPSGGSIKNSETIAMYHGENNGKAKEFTCFLKDENALQDKESPSDGNCEDKLEILKEENKQLDKEMNEILQQCILRLNEMHTQRPTPKRQMATI